VSRAFEQIGTALSQVGERLARLEGSQAPAAPPAADPAASGTPGEQAFQELYQNPEQYIRRVAGEEAKKTGDANLESLTPALRATLEQVSSLASDRAKSDFDREFGTGAWDRLVWKDLEPAVARLPLTDRVNDQNIRNLAWAVLGSKFRNEEGRKEINEQMARARTQREAPVMLHGSRPGPSPDRLTAEERDYVGRLKDAGIPVTEKEWLAARNRGNSEEDWGATWMKPQRRGAAGGGGSQP
jgi:hypothetical protein